MLEQKIRTRRKARGLSQQELADRLHVVRQTVSKWENGLSVPDAGMLVRIAGTWPRSWKRSTGSWPSGRNAAAGAGGPSLRRWESWPCGGP